MTAYEQLLVLPLIFIKLPKTYQGSSEIDRSNIISLSCMYLYQGSSTASPFSLQLIELTAQKAQLVHLLNLVVFKNCLVLFLRAV